MRRETDQPDSTHGLGEAPPGNQTIRAAALGGAVWTAGQKVFVRGSSLVTFILLARLLEPREFGVVAVATGLLALLSVLGEAGFGTWLLQRPVLTARETSTVFWTSMLLGVALSVATVALARTASRLMGIPDLEAVLIVLALGFPIVAAGGVPTALLRRDLRFDALARRGIASTGVACVVAVGLALNGAGVWALVAQGLTQTTISTALVLVATRYRPRAQFSLRQVKQMLTYGSSVTGVQLLGQIRGRADEIIIGVALGAATVGVYAVAKKILLVLLDLTVSVVSIVAIPLFARLKSQPALLRTTFVRASLLSALVVTPVMLVLAGSSPLLVPGLFGSQWAAAGPVAAVLALTGPAAAVTAFRGGFLYACDRPHLELMLSAVVVALHLATVVISAPYGLMAVAVAEVARTAVVMPVLLAVVGRSTGIPVAPLLWRLAAIWSVAGVAGLPLLIALLAGSDGLVLVFSAALVPLTGVGYRVAGVWRFVAVQDLLPQRWRQDPRVAFVVGRTGA